MSHVQSGAAARNTLITLAVIGAILLAGVMLLPRGFSNDTSTIGHGRPVAVLSHDKNTVYSQQLMELLNAVREDYAGRIEFVVVELGAEQDRAFLQQQRVNSAMLLLFGADGTRLSVRDDIHDEPALRTALERLLAGS